MNALTSTRLSPRSMLAAALLAFGAFGAATAAHAHTDVVFSVGVPAPVYAQPQPVYVQPQPVYAEPQPVYVNPQSVYVDAQPVYARPDAWRWHEGRRMNEWEWRRLQWQYGHRHEWDRDGHRHDGDRDGRR